MDSLRNDYIKAIVNPMDNTMFTDKRPKSDLFNVSTNYSSLLTVSPQMNRKRIYSDNKMDDNLSEVKKRSQTLSSSYSNRYLDLPGGPRLFKQSICRSESTNSHNRRSKDRSYSQGGRGTFNTIRRKKNTNLAKRSYSLRIDVNNTQINNKRLHSEPGTSSLYVCTLTRAQSDVFTRTDSCSSLFVQKCTSYRVVSSKLSNSKVRRCCSSVSLSKRYREVSEYLLI